MARKPKTPRIVEALRLDTSTAMDEQVVDDVLEACFRAMACVAGLIDLTRSRDSYQTH